MLVKFEQNRVVRTIQFFFQKMVNNLSVDATLEDVSVNETIVWC